MGKNKDLIFGIYPVIEALKAEINLDKVYLQKGGQNSKLDYIATTAEQQGIQINWVPSQKLDHLTKSNHQGVAAITSPVSFLTLENMVETVLNKNKPPLFIILDQISDVRNFGAIIRTAECTGVDGIIVQKKGGAPVSGDTVKTSAGAIFNVPICKVDHIKDAIYYLQSSGVKVIGATEKSTTSLYDFDLKEPVAIIMGSEGKGINKSVLNIVDGQAALPVLGNINSLNVSVACGVFLYEVIRQRRDS